MKLIKLFKKEKGFTLVEMAVVMGVFLFIVGATIGVFLSVVKNQKKVLAEQQVLNQISYVEEYLSKALRMSKTDATGDCLKNSITGIKYPGYIYLLTRYDSTAGVEIFRGIKFINQSDSNKCQEFWFDSNSGVLKELKQSVNDGDSVALTSSNLQINDVRFSINGSSGSLFASPSCLNDPNKCGASEADGIQPRVTITLNVSILDANQASKNNCGPGTACPVGQACYLSIGKCMPTTTIQTTVSRRNLNVK